ncbi:MAG: adenylyltransferase/cytidyltransferase family protein [Planctomycetes bacterium]|nr:adenylyltransferase/cytidyltransferase family protein [Planctomycetota bacterium]
MESTVLKEKRVETLEDLRDLVATYRAEGVRTVFTNGCFDILHVGHIRCLVDAKSRGDKLLVAINSDRSIRTMKGPLQPIFPEEERAEVIAAMACVDHIYIFDDLTVDDILRTIQPHVHAKGTDYTVDTVPERPTVLSYGGEIAIVGDPKNHSTSDIIKRIQAL